MVSPQTEAVTRQIQQAVDIVELIGEQVALRAAGRDHRGLCPFHDDKNPSLYVSPSKQIFKCFSCGVGGDVFKFIQLREGVDFMEARAVLARRAGIDLEVRPRDAAVNQGHSRDDLARVNDWAARLFRKFLTDGDGSEIARTYIANRQLSPETVDQFGLGYAPDTWDSLLNAARRAGIAVSLLEAAGLVRARPDAGGHYDAFRHRLMFPIRDLSDRVIGFGGRTLGDDRAKYINSNETALYDKSNSLYGLQQAKQAIIQAGRVLVVEGYMDCLMAHQHGLTETVAALGTAMTEGQVRLLKRFTDQAIVVFDSDEAGQKAADRAVEIFVSQQLAMRLAQVPEGKDPCDYLVANGGETFRALLTETAVDALEFRWRMVAEALGASESPEQELRAVQTFLRTIATSAAFGQVDSIRQGLLVNRLAKLLSLRPDQVTRALSAARRTVRGPASEGGPAAVRVEAPPPDAEQEAVREILEVLLNEPERYNQTVKACLKSTAIASGRLAAIAREFDTMVAGGRSFHVNELISRFEDPGDGQLITDLTLNGDRRGNHAATLEGAIACLERVRVGRAVQQAGQQLRQTDDSAAPDALEAQWASLVGTAKGHRHVLPPKALRSRQGTGDSG